MKGRRLGVLTVGLVVGSAACVRGQEGPAPTTAVNAGGTIRGTVKSGTVPLPGVAITATNTLTGKKYATTTDVDGTYAMVIPRTGRYVVRAELAAFAPATSEVRLTAEAANGTAEFGLQLSSRVAAAEASGDRTVTSLATALARGTQALSVAGDSTLSDASAGGGGAVPTLGLGGDSAGAGTDSIAVSGQQGQTNGLAGLSEDQIRDRITDAVDQARRQGGAAGDQVDAVVSMLGGIMGGGGGGGRGGPGGGGGRGGGGGGGFGRFNPTTPHGAIFYQGGFSGLDAQQSSAASLHALSLQVPETTEVIPKPGTEQNRFGVSFTGSPYIPGLTKPSTKQFVFVNLTGNRNINPINFSGTVPTLDQRGQALVGGQLVNTDANLANGSQTRNGVTTALPIYDPRLTVASANPAVAGTPFVGNIIPSARISAQARALLNLYPLPNVNGVTTNNYQNETTAGQDQTQASARYVRNFGATPTFGGGRGGGGGGGGRRNQPAALRQNINASFSFSHSASDLRNLIPILGGKTSSQGYGLSAGYTIGYGRLTNNASLNWNRSHATTVNFFTGMVNPATAVDGIAVPSQQAALAQAGFYNGEPNVQLTDFYPLTEQQPRDAVNQTISFSDFVSYGHKKHNYRLGLDVRRVHADQVGGNNVTGSFIFSGLVTESPQDKATTLGNSTASTLQPTSGSALADLLLGDPQETKLQAGLYKTYLRENVFDAYAQDDYRVTAGVTLNYGLRYEYFSPYVEKNNRLVNLDHNADFTAVDAVLPGAQGTYGGAYPRSLVNPDRTMFAPRLGVAWRPKFVKNTVVRAGYGINFNTGQFATFAQSLAFQPPFALTENNTLSTAENNTGCLIELPGQATNLTLANGFGCSTKALTNNYAVNKDYRLGHVQVYNLDIQRTLPRGTVVNIGYNGSKGGNLDIVRAPNHTAIAVTTANAQAFTYEDSVAESRLQQLVISARKRLEKGLALQLVYQYSHSIDNASSIGGTSLSQVQNDKRLDLEESNSSFDVRHRLTGNFVAELPFGPNRAFLSKGGVLSKVLDGFGLSGDFTLASGTYFSPQYQNSAAQLAAGGTYTLRPDRVFSQPIHGPKQIGQWFNPAAFISPQDTVTGFGTASRNSIEGPGTVSFDLSLSRTVQLGSTRSFETRATASNVFNTVQYTTIDTTENSSTFGQVTGTAAPRRITLLGRYRF